MAKKKKKSDQLSATEALQKLKEGNLRFVEENFNDPSDECTLRDIEQRKKLVDGQKPWAVILGCADSRVPPELIFDCGLGELFTIRVAGNIANSETIASIEYAVLKPADPEKKSIAANLVVVLGHEGCGAVDAAINSAAGAQPPDLGRHLNGLLSYITPAVSQLPPKKVTEFNNKTLSNVKKNDTLTKAVKLNVENTIQDLKSQSSVIPVEDGVLVVPAIYRLATGEVEFFES